MLAETHAVRVDDKFVIGFAMPVREVEPLANSLAQLDGLLPLEKLEAGYRQGGMLSSQQIDNLQMGPPA